MPFFHQTISAIDSKQIADKEICPSSVALKGTMYVFSNVDKLIQTTQPYDIKCDMFHQQILPPGPLLRIFCTILNCFLSRNVCDKI